MPLDTSLEATPVTVGALDEIAPDLPIGAWLGPVAVKNRINDSGYHQLILEWRAEESQTDDDTGVGGAVTEFMTVSPNALKMLKVRIKEICEAYSIEIPDGGCFSNGRIDGLEPFIEALESEKHSFWTTHRKRKDTGEIQVQVRCTEPGRIQEVVEEDTPKKTNGRTTSSKPVPKKGRR